MANAQYPLIPKTHQSGSCWVRRIFMLRCCCSSSSSSGFLHTSGYSYYTYHTKMKAGTYDLFVRALLLVAVSNSNEVAAFLNETIDSTTCVCTTVPCPVSGSTWETNYCGTGYGTQVHCFWPLLLHKSGDIAPFFFSGQVRLFKSRQ
jgi:hypothetical protein